MLKADQTEVNGHSGRIGALVAEDIVLHGKINTVASDLAAIELITGPAGPQGSAGTNGTDGATGPQGPAGVDGASLPVGADPGDILYWDGSVWQLTPAPPVGAATPLTLSLIAGVPTWTSTEAAVVYAIGDTGPAGGKVFYITGGGLHGLEAAPVDQSDAEWGCDGVNLAGASRTAVGAGVPNTADIVWGCDGAVTTAADIADAYTLNGYYDWFLPSKDELELLYQQKNYVGGFVGVYWSSSEHSSDAAWFRNFTDNWRNVAGKDNIIGVRAVRAF